VTASFVLVGRTKALFPVTAAIHETATRDDLSLPFSRNGLNGPVLFPLRPRRRNARRHRIFPTPNPTNEEDSHDLFSFEVFGTRPFSLCSGRCLRDNTERPVFFSFGSLRWILRQERGREHVSFQNLYILIIAVLCLLSPDNSFSRGSGLPRLQLVENLPLPPQPRTCRTAPIFVFAVTGQAGGGLCPSKGSEFSFFPEFVLTVSVCDGLILFLCWKAGRSFFLTLPGT